MLKDITYKEKFTILKDWLPSIIEEVKKDLKNDHLRQDWAFVKRYLPAKNINKIGTEDLVQAYKTAIGESEKGEEIAEFISNRWLLKNTDVYHYFEQELTKINPEFSEINEIEPSKSREIIEGAVAQFGVPRTYFFSVLNSVVYPKDIYEELKHRAKKAVSDHAEKAQQLAEQHTLEQLKRHYEEQIARISDRCEKKLSGMQTKYERDTAALKKQVAALQRQNQTK